ncbi:hypothetical protein ACGFR8_31690 [Streptomyces brevispora]|uniref:hypothetical protein n=1 Tax=Streptomyces brevispora TaxID=887462 RepID=UPI00371157C9
MRMPRILTRRPRPAVLLAAGLATALLGAGATLTGHSMPAPHHPTATITADAEDAVLVDAYNGGWNAGVAALGDGMKATAPPFVANGNDPGAVAWADGWVDGQSDARGDDNRDGVVDEDETGWDCATMGNRQCGAAAALPDECRGAGDVTTLCVTVVSRPAYGWTNLDGSKVDLPAGAAMVRDLDEKPGTPEFADALRALDAEYRAHARRA